MKVGVAITAKVLPPFYDCIHITDMDNRDSIDFGKMHISRLFIKLFIPTLLGLVFNAMVTLADGIFVGKGVGSNALAAVNIAAPIFLLGFGVSLMFATGVSIVAAVHLSRGNIKAANINATQALILPFVVMSVVSVLIAFRAPQLCYLFGGSQTLEPLVVEYLTFISPIPALTILIYVGSFIIRLDGSPQYAMYVSVIPAILNIFLDWLFVFPLGLGLKGAALATTLSEGAGAMMALAYLVYFPKVMRLYRPKLSRTSIRLTLRNIGYMMKLGFPTFIGETAISGLMIVGNFMFMSFLQEDGVAAFSVACYLFPLVYMFGNSIAQSQLPIISYNYGIGHHERIRNTLRLSLVLTTVSGLFISIMGIVACRPIISWFLDEGTRAFELATTGFPYFSISFVFFSLNVVIIGFYQSIERAGEAILLMLLRGCILVIPIFILLPHLIGDKGLWLAVPVAEALTFGVIGIWALFRKRNC